MVELTRGSWLYEAVMLLTRAGPGWSDTGSFRRSGRADLAGATTSGRSWIGHRGPAWDAARVLAQRLASQPLAMSILCHVLKGQDPVTVASWLRESARRVRAAIGRARAASALGGDREESPEARR